MENINIYESIGERTGGDIYMGVVGPVRAGKSTFIKRFMDLMVIPNVKNNYEKQRILDEMPQSGTGKTITTTEPKFVPAEAVSLRLGGGSTNETLDASSGGMSLRVRLVDCVGYLTPGAIGHMEEGQPRMVVTPWSDEKLPFEQAAEIGTEKVIREHSTIGIIITTDGSIGTMDREDYREAEGRVIRQMQELRKPFVIVMNSTKPESRQAKVAAEELSGEYGEPVIRMDCARASEDQLHALMESILGRFPVKEVIFKTPGYMEGLDRQHWLKAGLADIIRNWMGSFETIEELRSAAPHLADGQLIQKVKVQDISMGTGKAELGLEMAEGLYYRVITELMGQPVENDHEFFGLLREFAAAKKSYDKLKGAMAQVESRGYGIVEPKLSEMTLEEPEVFRQGNKYGIKITAKAPTLHIIQTDITTEVSPVVGSEKQSEDLVESLKQQLAQSPNGIWETNIFGKSLYEMVAEQMENKIAAVPDNIRVKMQKWLQKISDEGKEYFICIVI